MSAKTRRRKRRPALTPVPRPHLTLVDLRHPLPTRSVQAPHTVGEIAEARAALAARAAGIRVPVMAWRARPDATAHQYLPDGTLLTHTGGPAPFTATTVCALGAHHQHAVRTVADLHAARRDADGCTTAHADFTGWSGPAARELAEAFGGTHDYDPDQTLNLALPLHQRPQEHPDA